MGCILATLYTKVSNDLIVDVGLTLGLNAVLLV
jgi:hypothetical protein